MGSIAGYHWEINEIIINADQAEYEISEHIYGHFAEHLGRGIYGGIWVGEDSDIPNKEGYRTDVLNALKKLDALAKNYPFYANYQQYRYEIFDEGNLVKEAINHYETK